ncbi:hypothetical protein JOC75_003057 [Metabacillus crassostreae]|nr:hypothetical protein [Metabacillus crassostreae]MBM7605053.1 hypothetical protein [Metabacillus crassostreae]
MKRTCAVEVIICNDCGFSEALDIEDDFLRDYCSCCGICMLDIIMLEM